MVREEAVVDASPSPYLRGLQEQGLVVLRPKSRSPGRNRSPRAIRNVSQSGLNLGDSRATRPVELVNEDGTESIMIGATAATRVAEIKEIVGWLTQKDPGSVVLIDRTMSSYVKKLRHTDEVTNRVTVLGIKTWAREVAKLDHPVVVIGAGLGGIQTMIDLRRRGRSDAVCLERLADFGGHSWMVVSNKFTKLQTEKGNYHVDFFLPEADVPHWFDDVEYKTWPSRDSLLRMFRNSAAAHGLYDCTRFCTNVERVKPIRDSFATYTLATTPTDDDADAEITMGSGVLAWPGNLCYCRELEFSGEDDFDGYIEYSSFSKVDYSATQGKNVILYGHGAFTIENVRTLVEHRCKKVFVMCRKRNLCGMKMVSWLVDQSMFPIAGRVMLEAFQAIYELVNFDVWSAHSVRTDAKRSFVHISQKTVFGVTDIYFLAGYFGLMEVVVDEIKRCSYHCAHTKKGRKIGAEVIIKAIGTCPSFKIDKMLGLREMVGFWINGDPMRSVLCNGMFVEAKNFSSFSSGPGFASQVPMINWFIDWPKDFEKCRAALPVNRAGDLPAYVPSASHIFPAMTAVQSSVPWLAGEMSKIDALKSYKQRIAHPLHEYLAECRQEWAAYCKYFREHGMVDESRPDPEYPYNEEQMTRWMHESDEIWMKKQRMI